MASTIQAVKDFRTLRELGFSTGEARRISFALNNKRNETLSIKTEKMEKDSEKAGEYITKRLSEESHIKNLKIHNFGMNDYGFAHEVISRDVFCTTIMNSLGKTDVENLNLWAPPPSGKMDISKLKTLKVGGCRFPFEMDKLDLKNSPIETLQYDQKLSGDEAIKFSQALPKNIKHLTFGGGSSWDNGDKLAYIMKRLPNTLETLDISRFDVNLAVSERLQEKLPEMKNLKELVIHTGRMPDHLLNKTGEAISKSNLEVVDFSSGITSKFTQEAMHGFMDQIEKPSCKVSTVYFGYDHREDTDIQKRVSELSQKRTKPKNVISEAAKAHIVRNAKNR